MHVLAVGSQAGIHHGHQASVRVGMCPDPGQSCLSLGFYFSIFSQVGGVGLLGHRAGQD